MNRSLVISVCACVVLVAATAAGLGVASTLAPNVDRTPRDARGCPRDRQPISTTALLVDFTDAATRAHLSQLERAFSELRRYTPHDGKALVATLDVAAESFVTLALDVCNPGTRDGSGYTDSPSPAPQDQRWRHVYYKPFEEALAQARQSPPSKDHSPILEAITGLSLRADFDATIPNRRLVVVSDGLQLTPGIYSHFNKGDPWAAFQKSGLDALAQADLTEVDVTFVYLFRPEFARRQTEQHRDFLRKWFASRGARSFTLRGIAQGGES